MAVQHFVAFSRLTTGVAIVAGAPYGCNILEDETSDGCGSLPPLDWAASLTRFREYMEERAQSRLIDDLRNLRGKRVYLFSGLLDFVVQRSVMVATGLQLSEFTGPGTIKTDYAILANHGWVVDGYTCGNKEGEEDEVTADTSINASNASNSECGLCNVPGALLRCPGHDLAGDLLEHLLGYKPAAKRVPSSSPLIEVSQARYVAPGRTLENSGLWHTAYVYAPYACRDGQRSCAVHVHYHGCGWGAAITDTRVLSRLGLNEWAEAGNLVVVFPQASYDDNCWDWEAETGELFDTNRGAQLSMVMRLLQDLPRILATSGQSAAEAESDIVV